MRDEARRIAVKIAARFFAQLGNGREQNEWNVSFAYGG
jgi:hypothetical protein